MSLLSKTPIALETSFAFPRPDSLAIADKEEDDEGEDEEEDDEKEADEEEEYEEEIYEPLECLADGNEISERRKRTTRFDEDLHQYINARALRMAEEEAEEEIYDR